MIEVLRLGHRPQRDKRITTHVCLTARALGAARVSLAEADAKVADNVASLTAKFGGEFEMRHDTGWKGVIKKFQQGGGVVVHLTMYGERMHEVMDKLRAEQTDVMFVVGAEKVPGDLYKLADYNVAVGNQPHSEIAALALAMNRLRDGGWINDTFPGGEMEVLPNARGKTVRHVDEE